MAKGPIALALAFGCSPSDGSGTSSGSGGTPSLQRTSDAARGPADAPRGPADPALGPADAALTTPDAALDAPDAALTTPDAPLGPADAATGERADPPTRGPVGAYPDEVLADRPVAYYRFGESTGDSAKDTAARTPAARYVGSGFMLGAPGALAGDADTAVRLNGETGWISLADAFDFAGKVPFSIELWARPQVVDDKFRGLFTKEVTGGGARQGYLLTVQATAGLVFERGKDGLTGTVTSKAITAALYSHVVVTFDGSTLRLYVNGDLAAAPTPTNVELPDTTANAVVGARFSGNTPIGNAAHFQGDLDELALYDKALSPERVTAHYRAGKKLN